MDDGIEFAVNHADQLESIFTIDRARRRKQQMGIIKKDHCAKAEGNAVFGDVQFVFGWIKLDIH